MAVSDSQNPLLQETTGFFLQKLQEIWDEVGESDEERGKVLLQLEHDCLDVYKRKVDQAAKSRAQLLQALLDAKLEVSTALGEKSFAGMTIKEELAAHGQLWPQNERKNVPNELLVSDLSNFTTKNDLIKKFSSFGAVDVKMVYDNCSCYGFVVFDSTKNCNNAFIKFKDNCYIEGRKISVRFNHSVLSKSSLNPASNYDSEEAAYDRLLLESKTKDVLELVWKRDNCIEEMRQKAKDFGKDLVDVLDNLNRVTKIQTSHTNGPPLLQSVIEYIDMTKSRLEEIFKKHGLESYHPENELYDSYKHNVVLEIPDASMPPGMIFLVLKPGYMLNNEVIRRAEVGITKAM